jgi:geranylgeranylglycerol-phosphate geranylgeranyltransferase
VINILAKARAISELVRLDLVFGAGIFVVAGEVLGLEGVPPLHQILLGFLTGFFVSGSANIANDYFDRDVDRINRPGRPLPSNRITVAELWALVVLFSVVGLAAAWLLGPMVLAAAAVVWGVAHFYNMKFKEAGFFGNLSVAFCVGMTIIIGGLAAGVINGVVLTFAALAALFDLGEEIASDALDIEGDALRTSKSLAMQKGKSFALRLSGGIFLIFVALTFLPFLMGWLGDVYLLLIGIMDLFMVYFSFGLVRSTTTEEGHVLVRRLYLTWGAFMAVFIVSMLL